MKSITFWTPINSQGIDIYKFKKLFRLQFIFFYLLCNFFDLTVWHKQ